MSLDSYNFQDRMAAGKQAAMDARNRGRSIGSKPARQHKRPIEDNEINRAYSEIASLRAELRQAKLDAIVLPEPLDHGAEFDRLMGDRLAPAPRSLPDHGSLRGLRPGPQAMTIAEYLDALSQLGLTRAGKATAAALGLGIRQCIRLAQGTTPISPTIALLVKCYLRHGLPT
jgi:hypothetical protein